MAKPKRPRDPNALGKLIVDLATGRKEETPIDEGKNPHAVALGRLGGLCGSPLLRRPGLRKSSGRSRT